MQCCCISEFTYTSLPADTHACLQPYYALHTAAYHKRQHGLYAASSCAELCLCSGHLLLTSSHWSAGQVCSACRHCPPSMPCTLSCTASLQTTPPWCHPWTPQHPSAAPTSRMDPSRQDPKSHWTGHPLQLVLRRQPCTLQSFICIRNAFLLCAHMFYDLASQPVWPLMCAIVLPRLEAILPAARN